MTIRGQRPGGFTEFVKRGKAKQFTGFVNVTIPLYGTIPTLSATSNPRCCWPGEVTPSTEKKSQVCAIDVAILIEVMESQRFAYNRSPAPEEHSQICAIDLQVSVEVCHRGEIRKM